MVLEMRVGDGKNQRSRRSQNNFYGMIDAKDLDFTGEGANTNCGALMQVQKIIHCIHFATTNIQLHM